VFPRQESVPSRISVWCTSLGVGDTICATPTIRELRKIFPGCVLDVYSYYPELFAHNPSVDAACFFEEKKELDGSYTHLRRNCYARYFQTFFSSTFKPPVDYYGSSIIDVCSLIALNETFPDSEKWLEAPVTEKEYDSLDEKTGHCGMDYEKAVVIHPSRTWPTRTWPFKRWQELTDMLLESGHQVIAVGSSKPVIERRNELEAISMHDCPGGAIDCIDRLSLLETIALLNRCKAVVTVDSGLLHMALCTPINIVAMFTIVGPEFRLAWRGTGYDYRFAAVEPYGECRYCSSQKDSGMTEYKNCPKGKIPSCMPDAKSVFETFKKLIASPQNTSAPVKRKSETGTINHFINKGARMQPNTINPDAVCQEAIQAKLNVYQAKEQFETVLKHYNDRLDNLINLVSLMKGRILELEGELERGRVKAKKEEITAG
jgi:ADP-heptose:LPS heptosyltransferase